MEKINVLAKSANGRFTRMMAGKPMWAFWVFFTLLIGLLFGATYGVVLMVAQRWWIAAILIAAIGIIWGTTSYSGMKAKTPPKEGE